MTNNNKLIADGFIKVLLVFVTVFGIYIAKVTDNNNLTEECKDNKLVFISVKNGTMSVSKERPKDAYDFTDMSEKVDGRPHYFPMCESN